MEKHRVYDLEDRLINFTIMIIDIEEKLPSTKAGNYFGGQILRSGSSPSLNYGEAQAAESKADFIHKMKVILKELRETNITLKIIARKNYIRNKEIVETSLKECIELISIFSKSVKTAKTNLKLLSLISTIILMIS